MSIRGLRDCVLQPCETVDIHYLQTEEYTEPTVKDVITSLEFPKEFTEQLYLKYVQLEGGFWLLENEKVTLDPINLHEYIDSPDEEAEYNVTYILADGYASIHMMGTLVRLLSLKY